MGIDLDHSFSMDTPPLLNIAQLGNKVPALISVVEA